MPLFRIAIKQSKNSNKIRFEKDISIKLVSDFFYNPVSINGEKPIMDSFYRIYSFV